VRPRLGVERTCRLVGQQQAWFVCERPRKSDALALTTGQRPGERTLPLLEPDLAQQRARVLRSRRATPAASEHRHLHILERCQRRNQVVELKDEADRRRAVLRGVDAFERGAVHEDLAGIRPVERTDEVEQRALSAPRRTGQRHELARLEPKRGLVERPDAPILERLADALDGELRAAQRGRTQ